MKRGLLLLAIVAIAAGLHAQTRYEQEMQRALDALDKAEKIQEFRAVANKFELIAGVEKDKWLPQYYASYVYTVMTYFDKDDESRDKALDKAQTYLDNVKKLSGDKEEIAILQAYISQSRFFVAPSSRLSMFSQTSSAIEQLVKLYPENPRANLLEGIQLFHKPSMLGGGSSKAKPFFEKAGLKYQKQQLKTALDPAWGKETNAYYLAKC